MKRLIGYTAAICLLALMVGCGGVTSTGTLAYISNSQGTGFTVFTVNTDGTLTKSSISPQNAPAAPKVLQFAPNGKWAYFLDQGGANIFAFVRAGNGQLTTQIDEVNVSGQASSLVINSASTFIAVSLPNTKKIAVFSIDQATGDIFQTAGSPFNVGFAITQLAISGSVIYGLAGDVTQPDGTVVSQQTIVAFNLTSSGVLQTASTTPVGVHPSFMILSANSQFMYVLDHTSADPVLGTNIFAFNVSGTTLNTLSGQPFHENPAKTFNSADGTITSTQPFNPIAGATSNDSRFLFVANQGGHNISVFQIAAGASTGNCVGASGELCEVVGPPPTATSASQSSPFDCGCTTPSFIAVSNANNAVYALDTSAGKVFQFQINQNNGRLRSLSPASVGAESAASAPTWMTIR
jgi:6-phosphogluconolactonase (cycloisomerase 2 family)